MKSTILVSDEMITLIGLGAVALDRSDDDRVVFTFGGLADGSPPLLAYRAEGGLDELEHYPLVFVVRRAACRRLFASHPGASQTWHLTSPLRALAMSILECEAEGEARSTLRLARSIELLCQIHAALADGVMVPATGEGSLSEFDVARIARARRMVDQRWHEKLTIADLARVAGVNRDKLVRGFRDLYGETIAQVLSERRLAEARRMLLASDLPIAIVAYRCSYQNNAAFTRAFNRRFGIAPSELRRMGVAA